MGCSYFRQPWGGIEQTLISALTKPDDRVDSDPGSGQALGAVGPCLIVSGVLFTDTHGSNESFPLEQRMPKMRA